MLGKGGEGAEVLQQNGLGNAVLINSAAVCHLFQWEIYAVRNLSVVARKTKGTQPKFVDTVL